jgi:hypothetical protein
MKEGDLGNLDRLAGTHGKKKARGKKTEERRGNGEGNSAAIQTLGEIDIGLDAAPIPPRGWLLGTQFCRRFLSSVFAPGGTGKTALRTSQYLSLATGQQLTGQYIFQRCRVLVLSLEDDLDELRRRVTAALIHHKINRGDLVGWFFVAAPKGNQTR